MSVYGVFGEYIHMRCPQCSTKKWLRLMETTRFPPRLKKGWYSGPGALNPQTKRRRLFSQANSLHAVDFAEKTRKARTMHGEQRRNKKAGKRQAHTKTPAKDEKGIRKKQQAKEVISLEFISYVAFFPEVLVMFPF